MTDLVSAPVGWSGQVSTARVDTETQSHASRVSPDVNPFLRLVAALLVGYDRHSLPAYRGDLAAWAHWCAVAGVHPFDARRLHVDAWVRSMQNAPLPRPGKPMADTSIARRLSAVSKLYRYAIEAEVLLDSPSTMCAGPR